MRKEDTLEIARILNFQTYLQTIRRKEDKAETPGIILILNYRSN